MGQDMGMSVYGILIYDGVEPIDVGAAFGVLSIAKRIVPNLTFFGVARTSGAVHCANGLVVIAEHDFVTCPPMDTLIVTGGPGWIDAAKDPETLAFLRTNRAKPASMCTGALILDAAGLLDGKQVTTKSSVFDGEVSPLSLFGRAARPIGAALAVDGDVVTSGGITLGIDAIFYLLARDHGDEVAQEIARVMEYQRALDANRAVLGYA